MTWATGQAVPRATGDASIGKLSVGRDWIAGNLVTGGLNPAPANTKFGDASDATIGMGNVSLIAKVVSVMIKGVVGGNAGGSNHFGLALSRSIPDRSTLRQR